jgi:hypothetical protein
VATLAGKVGGAATLAVARGGISSALEQQPHQVGPTDVGGFVQCRHPVLLGRIHVGAGGHQGLREIRRGAGQGRMQRRHPLRITRRGTRIGTMREQQRGGLGLSEERRQRQRLKAIGRKLIPSGRISGQQRVQPRHHAHGGGFVDRQVVRAAFSNESFGFLALAVVQGIHDWRKLHSGGFSHGRRCYHGPPMIFVDYLGPPARLDQVREVVPREVASALRVPADQVVVRRMSTDDDRDEVELWVELSSDEQLYRLGRPLAQRISAALRPENAGPNVWVMYRVVPLSHAFLNGEARGRGTASLD